MTLEKLFRELYYDLSEVCNPELQFLPLLGGSLDTRLLLPFQVQMFELKERDHEGVLTKLLLTDKKSRLEEFK